MDIPVYLFTGFLEGGKTTFVQKTLCDERFNKGEKTLILLCEEGVEEYEIDQMSGKNIYIHLVEDIEDIDEKMLTSLQKQYKIDRVIIEYNGMWMLDELFVRLPRKWVVYQEMCFMDATTFISYNQNMRGLVVDKLKGCEIVVFNRFSDDMDKLEFHKIVRSVSRRCDIGYEYSEERVEYDDIEDPLPFDLEAPVVEIQDRDFAIWYRDMMEDLPKYDGLCVSFKGLIARDNKMAKNELAIGRHIMTCCVDDIQYGGLVAVYDNASFYKTHDWAKVRGTIKLGKNSLYRGTGPILYIDSLERTSPMDEADAVATFY